MEKQEAIRIIQKTGYADRLKESLEGVLDLSLEACRPSNTGLRSTDRQVGKKLADVLSSLSRKGEK